MSFSNHSLPLNTNNPHHQIDFQSWQEVANYVDESYCMPPSRVSDYIRLGLPADAVSLGQLASKLWLLRALNKVCTIPPGQTIAMLGSWVGLGVQDIVEDTAVERLYGIDVDPQCAVWSEQLNHKYVADNWTYKAVTADVDSLDLSDMHFITGGEAINVKPDIIINTSAEHMSNSWYNTVDYDQLVLIQTNDYDELPEHINTCSDIDEVVEKYPMRDLAYAGSMRTPTYIRHMLVGYPY